MGKKDAGAKGDAVLDPEVGSVCLFRVKEHSWIPGVVEAWDGKAASCKAKDNSNKLYTWENSERHTGLKADDVYMVTEDILREDVTDLLSLTVLHDSTLLNVLRRRYFDDYIYTNIGAITVALNPFNFKIPWYTDDNMPKYLQEGERIETNLPHSWATAHNTYWEMRMATHEPFNQCILVSGESGAGKTEASKIVMKYLAALSCKTGTEEQKAAARSVGTRINVTSPPLESFGNAKTVRNDNSSRFGKWMRVKFDENGFLVGAHITKYLLEKSRIVTASHGERVYHSFYLLCRAKDRAKWGVLTDTDYRSTSAGKTSDNKEFDTAEEFEEVCAAFKELNVNEATSDSMWKVVAGVMTLENADFEPVGEGSRIKPDTENWVDAAVTNWAIDNAVFKKELTTTTLHLAEGDVETLLNPVKAMDGRSALTKTLYDAQFGWLIETCNATLDVEASGAWIGLLDIFGFEDFELNSFEQLCINLANESLQNHYNAYIFERDMDECKAEGIDVTAVEFPDNSPCLKMISGKGGIFALLDEECALGKGSDESFLDKITDACASVPAYKEFFTKRTLDKSSFIIHHYAGSVSYEVSGFLDKNRDTLKPAFRVCLRASSDPFVAQLLAAPAEHAHKVTVGGFFKSQVADLMELINSTNPHWIRCVKPHPAKKPKNFHGVNTMHQLASSGVLGTVKIRKAGFPVRIPFDAFSEKYSIISTSGKDPGSIIKASGLDPMTAQLGKTRVFLKSDSYVALEKMKKQCLEKYQKIVIANCHAYLASLRLRVLINVKNKAAIDALRNQIATEFKAKWERERAEREAREASERQMMENIARQLGDIFTDEEHGRDAAVGEEDREWKRLLHDFEDQVQAAEQQKEARLEREEQERIDAEEAKKAAVDTAAVDIQRTVRGWLCRAELVRELTERARARTEFDADAHIFRQHMLMLSLDAARLQMEDEYEKVMRVKKDTEERNAIWKVNEARRKEQVKAVETRKFERVSSQQKIEEEVTEFALHQAHRLRMERQQQEELEKAERRRLNVVRRQFQEKIQADAYEGRERKKQETEEYMQRRRAHDYINEEHVMRSVQSDRLANLAKQEKSLGYRRGQLAFSERQEFEGHGLSGPSISSSGDILRTASPLLNSPPIRSPVTPATHSPTNRTGRSVSFDSAR
ncbi:Myosin-8 [Diplonema papillatum]|nr:Myosin-8 [Diplonema papillatum]